MRSSYSIWLTGVILLTVVAFLTVFQPVTFHARKDPKDSLLYLPTVDSAKQVSSMTPPRPFTTFFGNKVNLYLYKPQHDLRLGLDLRGGMRVVLEIPNRAEYTYGLNDSLTTRQAMRKQGELIKKLSNPAVLGEQVLDNDMYRVTVYKEQVVIVSQDTPTVEDAKARIAVINKAMDQVFGEGNYNAPEGDKVFKAVTPSTQEIVRSIMERRLNGTGLSEVTAYIEGSNRVVLEIPGVKEPDEVRKLLRTVAQMEFRLLPDNVYTRENSDGDVIVQRNGTDITHEEAINAAYLVVAGSAMKPNSAVTTDNQGRPAVSFELANDADRAQFFAQTSENSEKALGEGRGRLLAIVLDGKIISAPMIKEGINGQGVISGGFETNDEAHELSVLINAGALPVPVDIVENRTVSATLGDESVNLSMQAGLIGLALVLVFMLVYYRLPGLMANLALIIYVALSLAVLRFFDATLTLPGIAGIIISIGMAVDANVIIFERLKEELRTQKPLETAIDVAFARAWTAILDSNVASLITGSVLYLLGTGAVKGFAITLVIGVAVSMFTAVTVTRLFMKLMIRSKAGHNLAWYGI